MRPAGKEMQMKKLLSLCALLLCMGVTVSAAQAEEAATYTEQPTKLITEGGADGGEMVLRFYEETPHVPYMGIAAYSEKFKEQPLTFRENGDGTCALVNGIGEELQCDPAKGVITIKDWGRFFDLPLPLEDKALGWKDTTCHYVRFTGVDYEGEPALVTLDFAKYGIPVYADADDIYLPVSTLANIMTDIATNHLLYNGENLYYQRLSLGGTGIEGFYDSEKFKAEFSGEERPEDVVRQSYADLCFDLDYFFGHPGVAKLDAALAEKGLDQALTDLGEEGKELKEGLLSADLLDYTAALFKLFTIYLSDGHTAYTGSAELSMAMEARKDPTFLGINFELALDMLRSPVMMTQSAHLLIPVARQSLWGDDPYREYENTAIIRLDSFMPDEAGWDQYYKGEAEMPDDCLGLVAKGLKRASENPDIENVILDLSANSGGSPDVLMGVLALTTGQNQLYGIHKITGQKLTFTFEADTNFDGVYDEKDKEVPYKDFNYGALITRHAFSCGNLFPFIFQEGGAVLLGEPSSGGSCCIQVGTDPEGLCYVMSSAQWQLTDAEGNGVEGGCRIDLPISPKANGIIDVLAKIAGIDEGLPSFDNFFDDALLSGMMNEYFGEEELQQAA